MFRRQCRAQRAYRVDEPRLMAGDHVGVSLGDDREALALDLPRREVQAVESRGFVEEG